jgi:GNAT superfamily N-acetyltransferase
MLSPADLRASRASVEGLEIRQAQIPSPELNRFLYTAVGGDWYWIDRLGWTYAQWREWVHRVETWLAYLHGTPAGYFELEKKPDGLVNIAYFGLIPAFIGKGMGGVLLTCCLERAWEMGAKRVTVNTCTLDGLAALANYQARGLRLYKQETETKELPDHPLAPGSAPVDVCVRTRYCASATGNPQTRIKNPLSCRA